MLRLDALTEYFLHKKKQLVLWVADAPPKLSHVTSLKGAASKGAPSFNFSALLNFKLLNVEQKINEKINLRYKSYKV